MAYQTGTASDYLDLWDKLISFLTTDATLVADGTNWSIAWQAPAGAPNDTDIVLQGVGSTGNDQIYIGLRREAYQTANSFFIRMVGMTGVNPNAAEYDAHVNVSPNTVMYVDQNPMTYWFVANGRRFVVVVKISTVYETMCGGLFLPYSDPISYPYPLMVGGSAGSGYGSDDNWTNADTYHTHFVNPQKEDSDDQTNLWFLDPTAQWIEVDNGYLGSALPPNAVAPWKWLGGMGAYYNDSASFGGAYGTVFNKTTECLGGGFALQPAMFIQNDPANQIWGAMDGIYWVTGYNNAVENVITVNGVDHLVVQNVFRTGSHDYWALALE